jgi:hypothetical protein
MLEAKLFNYNIKIHLMIHFNSNNINIERSRIETLHA